MKKFFLAVIFLVVAAVIYWVIANDKFDEPFEASIMSSMRKIDGTGYAIVLRSVSNHQVWDAGTTTENLKEGDRVIVDKANNRILVNDRKIGEMIK